MSTSNKSVILSLVYTNMNLFELRLCSSVLESILSLVTFNKMIYMVQLWYHYVCGGRLTGLHVIYYNTVGKNG